MRFRAFLLLALATAAVAPALAASSPAPKAAASVLPWIDDDYARALSEAKRKKIPIFAELWAPWCHTCRSMQAFVFTDKALARSAKEFIWLSIDTEKAQNAPFVKKYPLRAWPSFYVIDPNTETVALRWVGGATVAQLRKFFQDGARAAGGAVDAALGKADALYAEGDYEKAAVAYDEALARLSPRSPGYARGRGAPLLPSDHSQPDGVRGARARGAAVRGAHAFRGLACGIRARLRHGAAAHGRGPVRHDRLLRGAGARGARREVASARRGRPFGAVWLPAVCPGRRR
jgi:thiol-disulfide isomerase/thioredoxin